MQAPDKSTIEKEKNGRYCCCCCADCSANGLARIRNYNRTFENKNKMNAVSEDDAVSTTVFAVLRRDHIVTDEEDIAPACRPTALCFTHTEDMAEDAVDEYAVSAFQKAVPEWKRPNGAAPDASPLDIAAEQWEDESNTWGGRIVDETFEESDMPIRPDDTDVLAADGITSFAQVTGRVGDVGALVRIEWPNGGFAEFYYVQLTPYIKEEMLHESAMTKMIDASYGKGRGENPPQRGGSMLKGPVGDALRRIQDES